MNNFIVASSKPWNKISFNKLKKKTNFKWLYVSTPLELRRALKKNTNFNYLFFLHWNWKVPQKIFEKHECICFHMTDLPYGRGGSPLQNLILKRKKDTILSAFKMTKEIDGGPIYFKKRMLLNGRAENIYKRADKLSWKIIHWIIQNKPIPKPQKGKVIHFNRRKPKQSLMPKKAKLSEIYDFIRMLDAPTYPSSFIHHGDFTIEFSHSKLNDNFVEARVMIKNKI